MNRTETTTEGPRTPTEVPRTPTEVLIPEARHHQRRRYTRLGIILFLSAVLVAGLTASVVVLVGGDANGKTQPAPVPAAGHAAGPVYFRPVLCTAPAYSPAATAQAPAGPPACSARTALTTQNLNVQPAGSGAQGFSSNDVPLDAALAGDPSTGSAADRASATVLLPALPQTGVARYALGPAQMTGASIESATARHIRFVGWVVDYTMTPRGAPLWDKVAQENFHLYLAIDLGGVVYSAPLIQPTQSSFSSFGGRGEISGNLTKAEALHLAEAMRSHRG